MPLKTQFLFKEIVETKKLLIWGEAGVGKTTFCTKFCLDWALVVKDQELKRQELTEEQISELEKLTEEQKSKLNNIGLLIYIVLRDIGPGSKSVKNIILSQLGFHKEGTFMSQPGLEKQLLDIFDNIYEHRKLVLLMDGFDEILDQDKNIEDVTTGCTYQNMHSITTCRPHATGSIVLKVDVEIRLKGFSGAQVKAFVEMFAKLENTESNQIESFVTRTISLIKSSADLHEMSTNPSMLQLLCRLLGWKKVRIGKDRTSVFKDYTSYLLMQYHKKLDEKAELYSEKKLYDLYHQNLLDAGKVALLGLKQNQLHLVFSKSEALDIGGDEIFKIGFLTELPSTDTDSVKVQFTHKTLQEFLAAFYVVNTPGDEGLQLLMQFCSTTRRLMGSQIILEFVSNMSRNMSKEIQKQIKDYIWSWNSDDKIDHLRRTSFLISMLEGNKTLQFPLPAIVYIELWKYDSVSGKGKNSALGRFFDMDGHGVSKINLTLGHKNRLNVLLNSKIDSVDELRINYYYSYSQSDNSDLCLAMKMMKPGLLHISNSSCNRMFLDNCTILVILQHVHTLILKTFGLKKEHLLSILRTGHHLKVLTINDCSVDIDSEVAEAVWALPDDIQLDLSGNQVTDKSACITLIHKATSIKSLNIHNCMSNCGIQINTEIAKAVSRLPDHTELDLSGNQVTDKSACITLIHKAATMKFLNIHNCISNCNIQIDTGIAEAVSRLPDHTELDMSGNRVIDKSACITLIHKAATMKSLSICNCGIQINTEIAESVFRLPDYTQLDLSGNQVTDKSACITLIHKAATMKSLNIHNCMSNCGIQIDTEFAEAMSRLPDHTQLNLSGNQVTDKSSCIALLHKAATLKSLNIHNCMSSCGIQIDTEFAEAMSRLPDHTQLDLSGNRVTDKSACITLIHKAATMKSLNIHDCISNCGIEIDTEIAEAVSRLPDHTQLDLSGNQVTDKSACMSLLHKAATMKSLNIHECISNCGIQIDTEFAEAMSRLPDHTQLNLSGNQVTDKSACIALLHKAATLKSLNIHNCMSNCGIQIDTEFAEAMSRLPDHTQLDLSGNRVTDKSACITLIHKAATMKSLNIHDCISNCGIQIDAEIAEAVSRLPDHTQLDLSGNQVTDKSACITLIQKFATMKALSIFNCGIEIDTEIAEAVSRLPDHTQLDLSGNQVTDKSACMSLLHKAATMKSLNIHECISNCGIQIDTELAEAVSMLSGHTELDLSGNQVTDKSACITLIHKAAIMKSLIICNCGIQIDTDIAEAVSRLPDNTQLDLSGNQVTDKSACITLIHKAATMRSLIMPKCMSNFGIQIDTDIARAVYRLPDHTELDLSGNQVTDKSACIILIHKAATMKSLNIHNCMSNCGIQIDTELAEAVSRLPDHTQLDLSGNQVTDKSARITLIQKSATMKALSIFNCGIEIDTEIAEAVSRLPDHTQLDLSGNQVTDKSACITLIHKAAIMKSLIICNCGIQIDTEIAETVSRLPGNTQLDLSSNQVTDKSACITLIHKAATMRSFSICNCGIQIDTEIAEAVSRLPDHTQLDLSGNQVTDTSACITLIHKAATMKSLNIHDCMSNCAIQIDTEIAEAVSRLPDHTQLDLSGNQVKDKSACITLIHKAATMRSLIIPKCMSNFGIQIDTDIARAVSRLPNHTELDLSGNQVTDKSACIILIHKAATMKSLIMPKCMSNFGIQIDTDIARAVSRLPDHTDITH